MINKKGIMKRARRKRLLSPSDETGETSVAALPPKQLHEQSGVADDLFEPTVTCRNGGKKYIDIKSTLLNVQLSYLISDSMSSDSMSTDDAFVSTLLRSDHILLAQWQYLNFYRLVTVFCNDIYGTTTGRQRQELLTPFFSTRQALVDFYGILSSYHGLNAVVKHKLGIITQFVRDVRPGTGSIVTYLRGVRTGSSTNMESASTPVKKIRLKMSYIVHELLAAVFSMSDRDYDLQSCVENAPELQTILQVDAARTLARTAKMTRSPSGTAGNTQLVVNFTHGRINITDDRVDTFTIPAGMLVWVVMASTPAYINYANGKDALKMSNCFDTQGIAPFHLAERIRTVMVQHQTENKALQFDFVEQRLKRLAYTNVMLAPRMVCLAEGDTYINKQLAVRRTDEMATGGEHEGAMLYRWNCRGIKEVLKISPPIMAPAGEVSFRFSELVMGAKMRGARQLVIADLSCACVISDSPVATVVNLILPTLNCFSLIDNELAGGN